MVFIKASMHRYRSVSLRNGADTYVPSRAHHPYGGARLKYPRCGCGRVRPIGLFPSTRFNLEPAAPGTLGYIGLFGRGMASRWPGTLSQVAVLVSRLREPTGRLARHYSVVCFEAQAIFSRRDATAAEIPIHAGCAPATRGGGLIAYLRSFGCGKGQRRGPFRGRDRCSGMVERDAPLRWLGETEKHPPMYLP